LRILAVSDWALRASFRYTLAQSGIYQYKAADSVYSQQEMDTPQVSIIAGHG
jgi:hypothetical protein